MALVTATGAALLYMGNKTRNAQIRQRMLELWKDRSKPPGPQWANVKRSKADWDLSAAALNEAKRIWALHQADLKRAGTTRNSGKTFFTGQDQIYISKNKEVKLSKTGEYIPQGKYVTLKRSSYSAIPGLTDGKGEYMTAKEFKTTFPTNFTDKPKPTPKVSKDGSVMIPDANGKLHKTYPNDALGHYTKYSKNNNYVIPVAEAQTRKNNNQSPNPNPNQDLPKTVKEYSSRAERNQNNQSLKINNKVEVQEENGSKTDYTAKYKQIGNLMINPGGLVGRNSDVRRSDGRSTALSIAQADFGRIKKGQQLGVMSTRERELYDRDVLGIG
tara:strand:+ start:406 stop:1392 length:987 start_codon:yes stop_codon:yes gene_type:complete